MWTGWHVWTVLVRHTPHSAWSVVCAGHPMWCLYQPMLGVRALALGAARVLLVRGRMRMAVALVLVRSTQPLASAKTARLGRSQKMIVPAVIRVPMARRAQTACARRATVASSLPTVASAVSRAQAERQAREAYAPSSALPARSRVRTERRACRVRLGSTARTAAAVCRATETVCTL